MLGKLSLQLGAFDAELAQGPVGDHIGQETTHGLLDAMIGEGPQVFQALSHAGRQRGLQLDGELAEAGVCIFGEADQLHDPVLYLS